MEEKAKEVISLFETSKKLNTFITTELPKLRKEFELPIHGPSDVDKHVDGFSERNPELQSVNMKLAYYSFSGIYGDSSVYSDINFDTEIAKIYFIKWLNKNADKIWLEVAELIKQDALKQQKAIQKELGDYKTKIENLFLETER